MLLGALWSADAFAQAPVRDTLSPKPTPPDTVQPKAAPRDTLAATGADSTGRDTTKVKKDTVKTRFAQAEMPALVAVGQSYTWDRAALFNTGMFTIADVLARVPGLTIYRSGWFPSPQYAAYLGNPARVRVFWDGIELLAIGNTTGYPLDLAGVPIWAVQEMTVERGVDEVRVYLRSWNVNRTTMQSRVDIVTGDFNVNLLRAFFGTRFNSGMGIQVGGQVYGAGGGSLVVGGGSGYDLLLRVGWARASWSVDGLIERTNGTRDPQLATGFLQPRGTPGQTGSRTNAYIRAGLGQPDSGSWWAQLIASQEAVRQQLVPSIATGYVPVDSLLATQTLEQVIATGGFSSGAFKLSGSGRLRWMPGGISDEVTGRASFESRVLSLSAFADYQQDSGGIAEAALKVSPTSFIALEAAAGYRTALGVPFGTGRSARLAAGLRLGRAWVTGGVFQRAAAMVPGLAVYDTAYRPAPTAAATGLLGSINGKLVEDLGIDAWAVRWQTRGLYRPQVQTRTEVFLDTKWLSRFPSGHFGFRGSFGHEFRSDLAFPAVADPEVVYAVHSNVLFANIQIRIIDATVYFTANWALSPRPYELVPRYLQAVQGYTYGLRWDFWN